MTTQKVSLIPKYSGIPSSSFWFEVNSLANESDREWIYLMGCHLQDFESRVLQALKIAQQREVGE